mgnify:CR=1 FL=1
MSSLSKNSAAIQLFHFLFPQSQLFLSFSLPSRHPCPLHAPTPSSNATGTTNTFHPPAPHSPTSRPSAQSTPSPAARRGTGANRAEILPRDLPPRAQLLMQSSPHNKDLRHTQRNECLPTGTPLGFPQQQSCQGPATPHRAVKWKHSREPCLSAQPPTCSRQLSDRRKT